MIRLIGVASNHLNSWRRFMGKDPLLQVVRRPAPKEDDGGPEGDADPAGHPGAKWRDRAAVPFVHGFINGRMEEQSIDAQEKHEYKFCPIAVAGIEPGRFRPEEEGPADELQGETAQGPRLELLDDVGDRLSGQRRADQPEVHDRDGAHRYGEAEDMAGFNQREYVSRLANPRADRRLLNPLTNLEY